MFHDTQYFFCFQCFIHFTTFFCTLVTASRPCSYDGQVLHYKPKKKFLPALNAEIVTGFLLVCHGGEAVSVCLGEVPNFDSAHLSQLACEALYGSDSTLSKLSIATNVHNDVITHLSIVKLN